MRLDQAPAYTLAAYLDAGDGHSTESATEDTDDPRRVVTEATVESARSWLPWLPPREGPRSQRTNLRNPSSALQKLRVKPGPEMNSGPGPR
ncbi:hypothetical protein ONO23_05499 [Micromonospora noduli]|nr:hypothetical protein ONO23_05499 [Micromonospora noduli]